MKKPIVNKVRCKKCNDIIESKSTHDFRTCKCEAIFIDGGREYQRYGSRKGKVKDYIDFSYSVYEEEQ